MAARILERGRVITIPGVAFGPGGEGFLRVSFAATEEQIAEMERCMSKLRQAGKKSIAYLENAGRAQFSIASLCDEILLADMGSLDIGSMSLSCAFGSVGLPATAPLYRGSLFIPR